MSNMDKHKFKKNSKYYTISIYTVVVVTICAVIIKMIQNWGTVRSVLADILSVISPFLVGFFIAYIINPMVKFFEGKFLKKLFRNKAKRARKAIAIILSYIIVISIIVTVFVYIVPQLIDSLTAVTDFLSTAHGGYTSILNFLNNLQEEYPQLDLSFATDFVKDIPNLISNTVKEMRPILLSFAYDASMSIVSGIINMFMAIVTSVYMLIDKTSLINRAKKTLYAMFSRRRVDAMLSVVSECNNIFSNFIVGKMVDSLIIGMLCFIVLTIIGIPYTLVISVIVGITNMIPYFGPFIGAIPGGLLLLMVDIKYAAIFVVVIIILQQFDGLVLGPKILGETTGLKPLWIIFAISIGGYVAGVLGMFLGVPTVAVISNLTQKYLDGRIGRKKIKFVTDEESGIISAADTGTEDVSVADGGDADIRVDDGSSADDVIAADAGYTENNADEPIGQ